MTRFLGRVAATAVITALLTGCGSNSSSRPDATGPSSDPTSSATSDPSASGSSSGTVTPATGRRIDVEGFTIHAPQGFDQVLSKLARIKGVADTRTGDQITVAWTTSIGQVPVSEAIRIARRNTIGGEQLERMPDVAFGGETFFRLTGRIDRFHNEEYGAIVDGALCFVRFQLVSSSPDTRGHIVASTMASFTPR